MQTEWKEGIGASEQLLSMPVYHTLSFSLLYLAVKFRLREVKPFTQGHTQPLHREPGSETQFLWLQSQHSSHETPLVYLKCVPIQSSGRCANRMTFYVLLASCPTSWVPSESCKLCVCGPSLCHVFSWNSLPCSLATQFACRTRVTVMSWVCHILQDAVGHCSSPHFFSISESFMIKPGIHY